MVVKGEYKYKKAILIDPEKLKAFLTVIEEYASDLEYSARLADQSLVHFENINELLQYSNLKEQRIVRLLVTSRQINVTIDPEISILLSYSHTVEITYSFTDIDTCSSFALKVDKALKRMSRPFKYCVASQMSFTLLGVLCLFVSLVSWVVQSLNNPQSSNSSNFTFTPLTVLAMVIAVIIFILYKKMQSYFFPPIVFYWGDEVERIKQMEKAKNAIFVVLLGGILISIAANFIWDRL